MSHAFTQPFEFTNEDILASALEERSIEGTKESKMNTIEIVLQDIRDMRELRQIELSARNKAVRILLPIGSRVKFTDVHILHPSYVNTGTVTGYAEDGNPLVKWDAVEETVCASALEKVE